MFRRDNFPPIVRISNYNVRNGKISTQSCSWHGNITHCFDKFSFELDDIYICFGIFLDETWSCPQIDFSFGSYFRFPVREVL